MKKLIVSCTVTLCGVICAIGYLIACSCGNGAKSSPMSYLDKGQYFVLIFFSIIALVSLFMAIKNSQDKL